MASGVCLVLCMLLAVGAAITAEEYEYLIRYEMARIRTMQELVQAANQSTYVKRTPIYPLFNPPPFQEVPREQPTAATIWGIPVVYLPAKHTPKGIVYLFYGGLLQPSSWFGDINKDSLMEHLHELGFHLIAAAAANSSEGWKFLEDKSRFFRLFASVSCSC
eukprot:m.650586 g.650586  ORF g.650586 m.650586 type:complete len:162 (-) comp58395_c0_seq35:900-1385(-)